PAASARSTGSRNLGGSPLKQLIPSLLMGALLLLNAPLRAQSTSGDMSLQEVVVVANRAPEPLSKVGSSVTVLNAEAIQSSQAIVASDLLAQTPGLSVARTGGVGQPTSVFIRGAESDQTVVFIDGVKMTDPSLPGGGYDFQNLLIGDAARIEILRGAQSTLYGSDAIGGVIAIETALPDRTLTSSASLEGGSHDTGYGTAAIAGTSDGLGWRVAADYLGTTGIPCFDQYLGGRRDCASQNGGAAGQLRYGLTPALDLDLRGYFVSARTDFDGFDTPTFSFGDDNEYNKTQQGIGYGGVTWRLPGIGLTNRVSLQYTDSETRDFDPNASYIIDYATTETF